MFKPSVMLGADPELFVARNGVIVGSEKVIPEAGLYNKAIVIDGVQLELNPRSSFNRADVAHNLSYGFKALAHKLKETGEFQAVFRSVVDVTKEELDSLSDSARIFGCAPSLNIYGTNPICVDPTTYLKRAAGGHIHLGLTPPVYAITGYVDERTRLVPLLDILVGNTCVLIDRDEGQVERRKYYGRAGEFRLPNHGLEYRTPSNFWLRSAAIADLVMGLSTYGVAVLAESILADAHSGTGHNQLEDELVGLVDINTFIRAINTNDVKLAWKNWELIRPFLTKNVPEIFGDESGIEKFERFATKVQQSGIESYFPEDPLKAWSELTDLYSGWRGFAETL